MKRYYLLSLLTLVFVPLLIFGQSSTSMKQQFAKKISDLTGVDVSIGDFELNFTTFTINNIVIGNQKPASDLFIEIAELTATADLMSILGGSPILREVNIASVSCKISLQKLEQAQKKQLKKNVASAPLTFADLPFLTLDSTDILLVVEGSEQTFTTFVESANINRKKDSDTIALNFVGDLSASGLHNRKNYDFKTRLSTNLKLEGQLSSPKINGSTNIYGFKVTSPLLGQSLYIRAGYVEFVDNSIRPRNLEIDWGSSKIYLSGEANKIFDPELALSYKIDPLAFAEISSAFVSTQGITLTGNGTAKGNIIGRLNDFSVKGSLNVPDFKIEAPLDNESNEKYLFPFKNLSASYNYAKETIQIKPVKTEIFGGKLSGQGKVFAFSNPVKFELNASGHSLKAENFLSTNTTQNNVVSGPFNVNLQAHGNALGLKTLNGKGNFLMNNGRYQTPPVVTPLLSLINLQEFASGPIETGKGTFNLKSGILSTQDLVFVANAGKAYYRGQIGLDTSLSGKMTIMFSQQAVAKSHTLKQISLNDRTANIPTRVEGTLLEPSFPGFGPEKLLELGLRRKGQKMLQDILSPQKNREADNNDNQKEDKKRKPEQQIIDGLKDIFKF